MCAYSNLKTAFPALALEWHPTKNGNKTPDSVRPKSEYKAWWIGKCGHEWQASVHHRTNGTNCPYCAGRKVLAGFNDFASKHPELLDEWDYQKNGDLRPDQVSEFSNKSVYWRCRVWGHSWKTAVAFRSKGTGCNKCSTKRAADTLSKRAAENQNSLAQQAPTLLAEWHPSKNGDLSPFSIAAKSNRPVWWLCKKCGYEWRATPNTRVRGVGCSKCASIYQSSTPEQMVYYYVNQHFSDAINGWRPTWLGSRSVDIYIPSLNLAIEYDGGFYHDEDQLRRDMAKTNLLHSHGIQLIRLRECNAAPLNDGSIQISCPPSEDNLSLLSKPLTVLFEHLSALSHNRLSPDIDPIRDNIAIQKQFLRRQVNKSLAALHPDLAAEWHPTKNESVTPEYIPAASHKSFWWQCKKGHEWPAAVKSRVAGNGCPFCSGRKALRGYNDLATTDPVLTAQWHPTKNKPLTPYEITAGHNGKAWWLGPCGHEWEAAVSSRKGGKVGCPFCANRKVLIGFNDLATTNTLLANEWHPTKNEGKTPQDVVAGSNSKAWWLCPDCGHEWQAQINSRNSGCGCPKCNKSARKRL